MTIENEIYKIKIIQDEVFSLDSTDNKSYTHTFNPADMKRSDYYKVFSINIYDGTNTNQIALIGPPYGGVEDVALLENDDLIVLMNTTLTVIDCCTLSIKFIKKISDFGIYFSIHKFENGYIVYGELDILKISPVFEREWSFSGADIFVSPDGDSSFCIEKDTIHLSDWEGRRYIINKFGEEIGSCTE